MTLLQCLLGMEIRQLRYLVLLAEELNFTRAAERANVAQPALSRQIRKLEDELGVALVDRTSRRVRLSTVGAEFVERARAVLQDLEEARSTVQRATQLLAGRISIGTTQTPGPVDVPQVLARFRQRHPAVELALREDLSVRLTERLRRDELDLAFISGVPAQARARIEAHKLASEDLCLIVPPTHTLAGRTDVTAASVRHESFVSFPSGATIRNAFEAALGGTAFEPAIESNDTGRIRALVSRGLGIAVLPRSDAESEGPSIEIVGLHRPSLRHEVFIAWRTGRRLSPAAAEFQRLARSARTLSG